MEPDAAVVGAFVAFALAGVVPFLTWNLGAAIFKRMITR